MEYKCQTRKAKIKPRLVIHGGAGNITPALLPPAQYKAFREALLSIVTKTDSYMHTPAPSSAPSSSSSLPTALEVATFAVTLLENNPLFNSAHGAVFTRDGINELEASVMVSSGFAKRGVGVMGLRRVRNPTLLAKAMLERGDEDLGGNIGAHRDVADTNIAAQDAGLDVPSAQGHTQIFGAAAEALAVRYGLEMVDPGYFFTQTRWDQHLKGLERERDGKGVATWSEEEYLPQGTCGAIALDEKGVVCSATSTGGLTNKLTGRVGDTPVPGAGFWAERWTEEGDPTSTTKSRDDGAWTRPRGYSGTAVALSDSLRGLMADCLPTPFLYSPVQRQAQPHLATTRAVAVSGTGNGDSFLRISAARTIAAMARFKPVSSAEAVREVAGPKGELQRSAGNRWGKTGEGEGGVIGIECAVVRDDAGTFVEARSEILQSCNCGGMFRAWIDERGKPVAKIWRED